MIFSDDKNNYALIKNLENIEKYKEKICIPHTLVTAFWYSCFSPHTHINTHYLCKTGAILLRQFVFYQFYCLLTLISLDVPKNTCVYFVNSCTILHWVDIRQFNPVPMESHLFTVFLRSDPGENSLKQEALMGMGARTLACTDWADGSCCAITPELTQHRRRL